VPVGSGNIYEEVHFVEFNEDLEQDAWGIQHNIGHSYHGVKPLQASPSDILSDILPAIVSGLSG
jgi:hypothetical protein